MKTTIQITYTPETDDEQEKPVKPNVYSNVTEFALVGCTLEAGLIAKPFRISRSSGGAWGILGLLERLGGMMEILRAMLPCSLDLNGPMKPTGTAKPKEPASDGD